MIELRRRYNKVADTPSYSRLPNGYQEVEWIQADGISYIDANIIFMNTTELEVDFQYEDNPIADFGFITGIYANEAQLAISKVYGEPTRGYSRSFEINTTVVENDARVYFSLQGRHKGILAYKYTKIDDLEMGNNNNVPASVIGKKMVLFAAYQSGKITYKSKAKIYSCVVKENGEYIRHLIPCRRLADNVKGMYDIVNDVFYTNAGTGKFLVGVDVHYNIPFEYQEVEYLESSLLCYINTGIILGTSFEIEIKYQVRDKSNSNYAFLFGIKTTENKYVALYYNNSKKEYCYNYNTIAFTLPYEELNDVSIFKCNQNTIELNTNSQSINVDNFTKSESLFLFNINQKPFGERYSGTVSRIYYVKIKNGTKEHNIIPCYRKADNVAGMYDLVSGEFHTNAGTGEFIVGPDII